MAAILRNRSRTHEDDGNPVNSAKYHKRSNVETTFSMIKAKFGSSLRGKNKTAQINEALCKVLCHNICVLIQSMFEFGITPTFGAESKAASNVG